MEDYPTRVEVYKLLDQQNRYINGSLGRIETTVKEIKTTVTAIDERLQEVEGCERDRETAVKVVKSWKERLAWTLGIIIILISITSFILSFVR